MAKFKLMAGGEINTLTKEEIEPLLSGIMASWRTEILRAGKYRTFYATAAVSSASVDIRHGGDNVLGPEPGMLWSIKSVTIAGLSSGDVTTLYSHSDQICNLIGPATGNLVYQRFGSNELVLTSGGALRVSGSGLTATGNIVIYGRCYEIPYELIGRL